MARISKDLCQFLKRSFSSPDTYPLYFMLGTACTMSVLIAKRHIMHDGDLMMNKEDRNDVLKENPATLTKTAQYMHGIFSIPHKFMTQKHELNDKKIEDVEHVCA
jgi:hypothetical protein